MVVCVRKFREKFRMLLRFSTKYCVWAVGCVVRLATIVAGSKRTLVVWVRPRHRRPNFLAYKPLRSDPNSKPAAGPSAVAAVVAGAGAAVVDDDDDDERRQPVAGLQQRQPAVDAAG